MDVVRGSLGGLDWHSKPFGLCTGSGVGGILSGLILTGDLDEICSLDLLQLG